jgi:1-acyl-sn-glycerol-3-phosphate acyltransferase
MFVIHTDSSPNAAPLTKDMMIFRSVLLVVIAVAVTAFMSSCAFLFPLISPGENKVHKIANLWARMLLWLTNTRVDVIGRENVLMDKPQIFMANHQSDFDILLVLAHIPGQFRWIAKKELFKIPVFGKAMRNAGYIEIDRQRHEKALKSLDEAAQKIREGKSVVTFPEGTRSKDGTVRQFKQGMFHLAIKAGVPIVPISIIGAGEIMPKRTLKVKPGRVTMVINRPVEVSGYTIETRGELIERVRTIIIRNIESRGMSGGHDSSGADRGKDAT